MRAMISRYVDDSARYGAAERAAAYRHYATLSYAIYDSYGARYADMALGELAERAALRHIAVITMLGVMLRRGYMAVRGDISSVANGKGQHVACSPLR